MDGKSLVIGMVALFMCRQRVDDLTDAGDHNRAADLHAAMKEYFGGEVMRALEGIRSTAHRTRIK
ncbi:MAG: hypothetical protein WAU02_04155 [Candidatus Saccharimonadales bacterium]